MGWYIYCFVLGWLFGASDWRGIFSEEIDCTHSWRGTDHCFVCGMDRE